MRATLPGKGRGSVGCRRLGQVIEDGDDSTALEGAPLAFGAVVVLAAMGILLFGAVAAAERLLFPWAARAEAPQV